MKTYLTKHERRILARELQHEAEALFLNLANRLPDAYASRWERDGMERRRAWEATRGFERLIRRWHADWLAEQAIARRVADPQFRSLMRNLADV